MTFLSLTLKSVKTTWVEVATLPASLISEQLWSCLVWMMRMQRHRPSRLQGAYMSFLLLRHLRLRDLQRSVRNAEFSLFVRSLNCGKTVR